MFKKLTNNLQPSGFESLAETFSHLGWMGFWLQVVLGSAPLSTRRARARSSSLIKP